jgi:hypothetical protein
MNSILQDARSARVLRPKTILGRLGSSGMKLIPSNARYRGSSHSMSRLRASTIWIVLEVRRGPTVPGWSNNWRIACSQPAVGRPAHGEPDGIISRKLSLFSEIFSSFGPVGMTLDGRATSGCCALRVAGVRSVVDFHAKEKRPCSRCLPRIIVLGFPEFDRHPQRLETDAVFAEDEWGSLRPDGHVRPIPRGGRRQLELENRILGGSR